MLVPFDAPHERSPPHPASPPSAPSGHSGPIEILDYPNAPLLDYQLPKKPVNGSPSRAAPQSPAALHPAPFRRKPGPKPGSRKRLWVWRWFHQNPEDPSEATCDVCGRHLKRNATDRGLPKKLVEHLRVHRILSADAAMLLRPFSVVTELPPKPDSGALPTTAPHHRSPQGPVIAPYRLPPRQMIPIQPYPPLIPFPPGQQQQPPPQPHPPSDPDPYSPVGFQKAVVRFLAENKLPILVVQLLLFRQLVGELRPQLVPAIADLTILYLGMLEVLKNEDEGEGTGLFQPNHRTQQGQGSGPAQWDMLH